MKNISMAALFVTTVMGVASANASVIAEVESNDSIATAQNINSAFSVDVNANIENSNLPGWESVSISGTGNNTHDFFSFTAQAGQHYIFDVDDGASNMDAWLNLYTASGVSLSSVDDCRYTQGVYTNCNVDSGSTSTFDPTIDWVFATAGEYFISMGTFCCDAPVNNSATYQLQISRDMATAVPEPGSIALLGLGLAGLAYTRRKRA